MLPEPASPTPPATASIVFDTNDPIQTNEVRNTVGEACAGDCDGDGKVAINELIKGVNIALGNAALDTCSVFDSNGDQRVAINELIRAVNKALNGCG